MTTKMEWKARQRRLEMIGEEADALIARLGLTPPIDPLEVARSERRLLRTGGADLGNRYDGKLEYDPKAHLFLLFYNTKYDRGLPLGIHHPRTRFSISHELGHFFLEHHHDYLRRRQRSHHSVSEFRRRYQVEREADAFAASLLLPTAFARPAVNTSQLSIERIEAIAKDFNTSLVCATFRSVRLSHFPCAVAGIQDGVIAWLYCSKALIDAGIYPCRDNQPPNSTRPWEAFADGLSERFTTEGEVRDWFQTYERHDLERVSVREEFMPVQSLGTLLVLLTIHEDDLDQNDDDDEPEDD